MRNSLHNIGESSNMYSIYCTQLPLSAISQFHTPIWNIGRTGILEDFLSLGSMHVSIFSSLGVFFSWHFLYMKKDNRLEYIV